MWTRFEGKLMIVQATDTLMHAPQRNQNREQKIENILFTFMKSFFLLSKLNSQAKCA